MMHQTKLLIININLVRDEVKSGKTKIEVANELGISYYVVKKYTKDIPRVMRIPVELEQQIRKEVKSGKTKIDVANELGISYKTVRRYTRDIPTVLRIPVELEQQIREEVKKGKTKKQVAIDLNVSDQTVKKYTRDIISKHNSIRKKSPELIEEIRANVKKYNSKIETARKMGISYNTVLWYTKDIIIKKVLPSEQREKIRNEVKNGKSKIDVARELNISPGVVYHITKDIYTRHPRNLEKITGLSLELLKELMQKGYAFSSNKYRVEYYRKLKKYFPNIHKINLYGRVIFFLREHKDEAMKAFLETVNLKIIKYNRLKQIIDVFDVDMKRKDKKRYIRKTN